MGKTVNTRIKQKLDTLENWNSSDIILLQGELAVISSNSTDIKLKIGDGENKLSDLAYVNSADFTEVKQEINSLSSCLSTYFNGQTFDSNEELNNSVSGMYATIGKLFELFGGTYIPPSAS